MLMNEEIVYQANECAISLLFFVSMLVASEAGFRIGRRHDQKSAADARTQAAIVTTGILAVLGLLLGFTMSMSVSRYEARVQLVLKEANAIRTAHLRAQLLPLPEREEIAARLVAYANVRVAPRGRHNIYEYLAAIRKESARLQSDFWHGAVGYARKEPNPVTAGLLLQSLNEVIEVDAARWMAFQNYVPTTVIYVIALVGLLAGTMEGYMFGLGGPRQFLSICALALAVSLVLTVTLDLDRPGEGLIRVSQGPLLDLQKQLNSR